MAACLWHSARSAGKVFRQRYRLRLVTMSTVKHAGRLLRGETAMPAQTRSWVRRGAGPWGTMLVAALACGGTQAGDVPDEPAKPCAHFAEEQLLQQLTMARTLPEITRRHAQALLRSYQAAFDFNQHSYTDPTILLREF